MTGAASRAVRGAKPFDGEHRTRELRDLLDDLALCPLVREEHENPHNPCIRHEVVYMPVRGFVLDHMPVYPGPQSVHGASSIYIVALREIYPAQGAYFDALWTSEIEYESICASIL